MFTNQEYELLDFGDGRRLERFGQFILDRPCPAAEGIEKANPKIWSQAKARYVKREPEDGNWRSENMMPLSWQIKHANTQMELKLTDFGHVGVFPEHAGNWDWLSKQVKAAGETLKVLNLFAYTGGATLACAAAGAEVVHVDSAQNSVLWARRNTESSGLSGSTIRWITEDALKFVGREIKRGNKYHGLVLDPPSYGHGPKGEVWKIQNDLPELLRKCGELIAQDRRFILLSCHTKGYVPADLQRILKTAYPDLKGKIEAGGLAIRSADGRNLPCGIAARWSVHPNRRS